jgi:hypothetical protein
MIQELTREIKSLREGKDSEEQASINGQIKKLEKLLEKKEQRAEQEEFHYQLKRVASL